MKKSLLQKVKKAMTPDALCEALGIEFDIIDISHRGGNLGFYNSNLAGIVGVDEYLLPRKFGVYCNYLGGGLRGAICASDFSKEIPEKKAKLLREIGQACVRAYNAYENESHLNDEEYPDGDTNWDAIGTQKNRMAGVVSAY